MIYIKASRSQTIVQFEYVNWSNEKRPHHLHSAHITHFGRSNRSHRLQRPAGNQSARCCWRRIVRFRSFHTSHTVVLLLLEALQSVAQFSPAQRIQNQLGSGRNRAGRSSGRAAAYAYGTTHSKVLLWQRSYCRSSNHQSILIESTSANYIVVVVESAANNFNQLQFNRRKHSSSANNHKIHLRERDKHIPKNPFNLSQHRHPRFNVTLLTKNTK